MTVKEFYGVIGGDYEDTVGRFRKEELVKKFLKMFIGDPSMGALTENMLSENYAEAFRAAHTLKGVAANLGMKAMQAAASDVTEALRGDSPDVDGAKALIPALEEIYGKTVAAINELAAE